MAERKNSGAQCQALTINALAARHHQPLQARAAAQRHPQQGAVAGGCATEV